MVDFTNAEANRLIQLYTEAEADLLREYNKALLKGNDLKVLAQLKRNVGIIRQDLLKGGRTWCEDAVPSLYKLAGDETGLKMGAGFNAIHQQAMKVLADNAYQRLVDVDQVIGRRVDDVYRNLALESLRGDIVGYETWKQAAKAYRARLAEKGITGFRDAPGRDWNMKTYSEVVARTTVREAMIEGTSNRLLEHGHDLARIAGGSAKNTCDACKTWVGKIISLTGKTSGYPTMADARVAGVFHPRCTHTISSAMTFEGEIFKARIHDATPEEFIKARDEMPASLRAFLTPYTAEEYKAGNVRLRMVGDGDGGYGLKGDELISVFSKPGKHLGLQLVEDAIENGAERLDCLGERLVYLYNQKGFKVVKTDKWDDQYAPKDWDPSTFGRPNLYYMRLEG